MHAKLWPGLAGLVWLLGLAAWAGAPGVLGAQGAPGAQDLSGASFGVMTLNLHTWQQAEPRAKLDRVADFIARRGLSLVALQEVGQHLEGERLPAGAPVPEAPFQSLEDALIPDTLDYPGNAAWYLVQRLKMVHGQTWWFAWTWAHIGFGEYEEGVAVLSRYPLENSGWQVVSAETDRDSISSRRILWADLTVPGWGPLRFVSAHLGWGADQLPQVQRSLGVLKALPARPTLLAGDFNLEPSAPGYRVLTQEQGWRDQVPAARVQRPGQTTMAGRRIDYQFAGPGWSWPALEAYTWFRPGREGDEAPVSDHAALVVLYGR